MAGFGPFGPLMARLTGSEEVVAIGGDLDPQTLLAAYRRGLFPMGLGRAGGRPLAWWSPDPRGVLHPADLRVSRSLRRSMRRFTVSTDTAFEEVLTACADPSRPGRWITPAIAAAYTRLHRLGHAHSVEVWQDGRLVGGLYGVQVGGLFAGESMFHRERDASKAALVRLCGLVAGDGDPRRLIDVQWCTPHLASLGACEVSRAGYLALLEAAREMEPPTGWTASSTAEPPACPSR